MFGIFRDLFDLNRDGKVDPTEQAMEIAALQQIMDEEDANYADFLEKTDDFDLIDDSDFNW